MNGATDWEQGADEFELARHPGRGAGDAMYSEVLAELQQMQRSLAASKASGNRRDQVAAQIVVLEGKLQRARELHDRLAGVPSEDPWGDGAVLVVHWRGYSYALIRAGGLWYSTGRDRQAPYRFTWTKLVDWLVTANADYVMEMAPGRRLWLGNPMFGSGPHTLDCANGVCHCDDAKPARVPMAACTRGVAHNSHTWHSELGPFVDGDQFCPGLAPKQCSNTEVHPVHIWGAIPPNMPDMLLCQGV